jgi:hypothetical protein
MMYVLVHKPSSFVSTLQRNINFRTKVFIAYRLNFQYFQRIEIKYIFIFYCTFEPLSLDNYTEGLLS